MTDCAGGVAVGGGKAAAAAIAGQEPSVLMRKSSYHACKLTQILSSKLAAVPSPPQASSGLTIAGEDNTNVFREGREHTDVTERCPSKPEGTKRLSARISAPG